MNMPCIVCGQRENPDDLSNYVVTISAYKAGEWSDASELPDDLRVLAKLPNPRAEMHAACAAQFVTIHPDLLALMVEKEVRTERIPAEIGEKLIAKAKAGHEKRIGDAAKKLGLKKGA